MFKEINGVWQPDDASAKRPKLKNGKRSLAMCRGGRIVYGLLFVSVAENVEVIFLQQDLRRSARWPVLL